MNVQDVLFTEIANRWNEQLKHCSILGSTNPMIIHKSIFAYLQGKHPELSMKPLDERTSEFRIEIPYAHNFRGIEDYDKGIIRLDFSIQTKRTERLTSNRYVHIKHEHPITFLGYRVTSTVPSFEFESSVSSDLMITGKNSRHFNHEIEGIFGESVSQLLTELRHSYPKQIENDLSNLLLREIQLKGERYEALQSYFSYDLVDAFTKNRSELATKLTEFVFENELISERKIQHKTYVLSKLA